MINVKYIDGSAEVILKASKGDNLLEVLKTYQINVYGTVSSKLNCGGRGICATCGVYIVSKPVKPTHWHDKLAHKFGYPRLSCQVILTEDIVIRKPDQKIVWGQLLPKMNRDK